jgi:hypothetical protein
MSAWTGLKKGEVGKIADDVRHDLVAALTEHASCLNEAPEIDGLIDSVLLMMGCPADQLATCRAQIREWPFPRWRV